MTLKENDWRFALAMLMVQPGNWLHLRQDVYHLGGYESNRCHVRSAVASSAQRG